MFDAVIKRGSKPSADDCEVIAFWLNANNHLPDRSDSLMQNAAQKKKQERIGDAITLIQAEAKYFRDNLTEPESGICSLSYSDQETLSMLDDSLNRARFLLAPPARAWQRKFSPLAFGFAVIVVVVLRRAGSTATTVSGNTHAARFVELALARIGWKVGREDIANLWHDWMARPGIADIVNAEIERHAL